MRTRSIVNKQCLCDLEDGALKRLALIPSEKKISKFKQQNKIAESILKSIDYSLKDEFHVVEGGVSYVNEGLIRDTLAKEYGTNCAIFPFRHTFKICPKPGKSKFDRASKAQILVYIALGFFVNDEENARIDSITYKMLSNITGFSYSGVYAAIQWLADNEYIGIFDNDHGTYTIYYYGNSNSELYADARSGGKGFDIFTLEQFELLKKLKMAHLRVFLKYSHIVNSKTERGVVSYSGLSKLLPEYIHIPKLQEILIDLKNCGLIVCNQISDIYSSADIEFGVNSAVAGHDYELEQIRTNIDFTVDFFNDFLVAYGFKRGVRIPSIYINGVFVDTIHTSHSLFKKGISCESKEFEIDPVDIYNFAHAFSHFDETSKVAVRDYLVAAAKNDFKLKNKLLSIKKGSSISNLMDSCILGKIKSKYAYVSKLLSMSNLNGIAYSDFYDTYKDIDTGSYVRELAV